MDVRQTAAAGNFDFSVYLVDLLILRDTEIAYYKGISNHPKLHQIQRQGQYLIHIKTPCPVPRRDMYL